MKRKELIRHLETHGCELLRRVAVTLSMSIELLTRPHRSRVIAR
jgi:hypothetical protein